MKDFTIKDADWLWQSLEFSDDVNVRVAGYTKEAAESFNTYKCPDCGFEFSNAMHEPPRLCMGGGRWKPAHYPRFWIRFREEGTDLPCFAEIQGSVYFQMESYVVWCAVRNIVGADNISDPAY